MCRGGAACRASRSPAPTTTRATSSRIIPSARSASSKGARSSSAPIPRRYAGLRITPQVSRLATEVDVLADLLTRAGRRGLAVRAWTVFLHNTTLGSRHPDCAPQNVFGDPYITNLCPANPDVRAYARALAADLASHGVETILAESLELRVLRPRLSPRAQLHPALAGRALPLRPLLLRALHARDRAGRRRRRGGAPVRADRAGAGPERRADEPAGRRPRPGGGRGARRRRTRALPGARARRSSPRSPPRCARRSRRPATAASS